MRYQLFYRCMLIMALLVFIVLLTSCGSTIKKPYIQIYDEMISQAPAQPQIMNTAKSDTIPEPRPPKPRISYIEWGKMPRPIPSTGFFNVTTFVPEKPSYKIGQNQIEIMKLQNTGTNIPIYFIKELAPGEMYFIMRIRPKQNVRQTTRKNNY